jgi:hypothetical protein
MRKGALLLAFLMIAAAPTAALAAKKKAAPAAPAKYDTTPANSNESTLKMLNGLGMEFQKSGQPPAAAAAPAPAPAKKMKKASKKM